jgi:peptide/nickel transport system substrate-binding protein
VGAHRLVVARFRTTSLLAITLTVTMLVTGCSSSSNAPGKPGDVGAPQYGGVFKYASVGTQTAYDPVRRGVLDAPMSGIYDSLLRYSQDGHVEPYLAKSMESDDAKTWTLTLRPDVKFHDGTALDADAVVFNIQRHRDPANASTAASYVKDIASVEAVDPLTVQFQLSKPVASFPSNLTTAAGAIASPTAVKQAGKDYGRTVAVGAGPFVFKEWRTDQRTVLKRNNKYWQKGLPYLDEFWEVPMSDTETRFAAFQGNQVDAAWFQEPTQINWARQNPNLATLHAPTGGVGGTGLVFQLATPPFDDHRVREAVARAVNYDALNQALFRGTMPRMQGPFVEGSIWYTGKSKWPAYNQQVARALVEDYKREHAGKLSFTLGCHNAPARRRYVELLQSMFTEVGMDVKIETPSVAEYVDNIYAKKFQVGCFPKNGTDPDLAFYSTFVCDGPSTANFMGYCAKDADEALNRGRRATAPDERKSAYADFEAAIARDLPMVWHWGDTFSVITKPRVQGYVANPSLDEWQPAYLWLQH